MFNSQAPKPDDLPTSAQLVKSTIISVVAAGAILVTVVLPSEYAIDPTGIGSALGLKEMGEIKTHGSIMIFNCKQIHLLCGKEVVAAKNSQPHGKGNP